MPTNPVRVNFDEENLQHLEKLSKTRPRIVTNYVNRAVTDSRTSIRAEDFMATVDMPKTLRLRSSSTTADVERIITLSQMATTESIILGARECDLNSRVLCGFVQFGATKILFDNIMVNHARSPRISEVEHLLKKLASSETTAMLELLPEIVEPTIHLPADEAIDVYEKQNIEPFKLKAFLQLIAPTQTHENLLPYQSDDGYTVKLKRQENYGPDELVEIKSFDGELAAEAYFNEQVDRYSGCNGPTTYSINIEYYGVYLKSELIAMDDE